MKRLRITGLAILVLVLAGCADPMPEEMPADFDFRLSYGVHGNKGMDTFRDVAVKDLVEDGSAEANVVLSEEEMETVYRQLAEINVIGDLDLVEKPRCQASPSTLSTWQIVANGETAEFAYGNDCGFEPRDVRKLRALELEIHDMVTSKEAYQALPEARGAYE